MTKLSIPQNTHDIVEIVRNGISQNSSIEIIGAGTKRSWGRDTKTSVMVDLSNIAGITLYEPQELVLTANAGTPIEDIQEVLSHNNQQLAFEPPNWSFLFNQKPKSSTLGGVIATNLSGPRRIQSGAARDYCLGFEAVSGRGEEFKSGGRVVKNVTGFDLSKLLTGSFGTLAIITSVTIKVLPTYPKTRTVLLFGLEDKIGITALSEALRSPFEVNAASFLSTEISQNSNVECVFSSNSSITAVRLQGTSPSIDTRCESIVKLWASYGDVAVLHSKNSLTFWTEISDVSDYLNDMRDQIWRVSVAPSQGANIVAQIKANYSCKYYFDWGGGLIWLAFDPDLKEIARFLRSIVDPIGGYANLIRASSNLRREIDVFHPQEQKLYNLTRLIKENFAPSAILTPGRMYKGI